MIERDGPLSLSRQCALLGVSRSSQYYRPKGESAEDLALMRRMDELHMAYPFYGSRQLMRHLRREGVAAGRHRIRRLMRLMGMEAIYRRPRTSVVSPEHRVFPYLLRGLTISRADHVWCADITYVPVTQGFFYLVAVMDWATRHVLAWRLSNTMDASFCVQALDDALGWRAPEILNTDQGSQFTSEAFADRVLGAGVRFSMDGRGRFLDNIFIERLWRSLKYEAVYLYELRDGPDAQRIIGSWIDFYNKCARTRRWADGRRARPIAKARRCGEDDPARRHPTGATTPAIVAGSTRGPSLRLPIGNQSRREGGDYIQTGLEGEHPASSRTPKALETIRIHLKIAPGLSNEVGPPQPPEEELHGRVVVNQLDPAGIGTRQYARVVGAACDGLIAEATTVRDPLGALPGPVRPPREGLLKLPHPSAQRRAHLDQHPANLPKAEVVGLGAIIGTGGPRGHRHH